MVVVEVEMARFVDEKRPREEMGFSGTKRNRQHQYTHSILWLLCEGIKKTDN